MRKIAFGYSTRCNVQCEHCVAAESDHRNNGKMDLLQAKEILVELAHAHVQGISFTAGEPLIYLDDICELLALCNTYGIYTRVVTNSFWAKNPESAQRYVSRLMASGLSQLRLSYSRWHQKNIKRENVINAVECCVENGLDYFISFVTDFSEEDDQDEEYLRQHKVTFFPEPVIFSGRAESFERAPIRTDYQENCCSMNPYLAPNFDVYACCDAGSHFTKTNFFHLGNAKQSRVGALLLKSETNTLYKHIRTLGISGIASFAGFRSKDIITHRKCELCKKLFNDPDMLRVLENEASSGLAAWHR